MIKEYFKELRDLEIYEEEHGFVLFQIRGNAIYFHDVYVKPEYRRTRVAYTMADNLIAAAKDIGCTHVMSDIQPSDKTCTAAMKFNLNYGMKILEAHEDEIILGMEIK